MWKVQQLPQLRELQAKLTQLLHLQDPSPVVNGFGHWKIWNALKWQGFCNCGHKNRKPSSYRVRYVQSPTIPANCENCKQNCRNCCNCKTLVLWWMALFIDRCEMRKNGKVLAIAAIAAIAAIMRMSGVFSTESARTVARSVSGCKL